MDVEQRELRDVMDSVCNQVQRSVQQTTDSVVRQSRQRLSVNQNDPQAVQVLAASSLVGLRPARTLDLLKRTPALLDKDATANRLAAYAYLAQSDTKLARRYFDHAVRLDPNQPDCWHYLGRIAERDQGYQQAAEYYERGILFDNHEHVSAIALAQLHARNRKLGDAIHTLRVALLHDRRSPHLNLSLAELLQRRAGRLGRQGRHAIRSRMLDEASSCLQIVNACAPTAKTLIMQGKIQQKLFRHADSRDSFAKAAMMEPNSASAVCLLAGANVDFGDIETAKQQFQRSIALDPNRSETHFRFTRINKFRPCRKTQRYLRALHQLLGQTQSEEQKQIHLHFSLGKIYDDLGQYDRAWNHFDQGNRLKTAHSRSVSVRAKPQRTKHVLSNDAAQRAEQYFTPELFAAARGIGSTSKTPIFIVGMPRSGTTLTEQILSSHPLVAGAGELSDIHQIQHEICRRARKERRSHRLQRSGVPQADQQDRGLTCRWETLASQIQSIAPQELRQYAEGYLDHLDQFRESEMHVTDKMPTNFIDLGLIAVLFPGATVIHCQRHPIDVMVSCYCQNLSAPFCDIDQMIEYHRNYRRLMRHWERTLPIRIHTSRYEDLVSNPEPSIQAMLTHCDLPWSDACMQFQSNRRAVNTPSKWQVRQPLYQSSIEKWRRFEPFLAETARKLEIEIQAEQRTSITAE